MSNSHIRRYLIIWVWLLILVAFSVAATSFLPKFQALVLIFSIAVTKTLLIARNYMHLKNEKVIIYAMALVPMAFVIILLFGLFPDFVYRGHP